VQRRTEAQKAAVVQVVEDLERAGVKDVDFTGTTWRLVFSTATTESAGKLGPFTGRVRQARSSVYTLNDALLSALCDLCSSIPSVTVLAALHCFSRRAAAAQPQSCDLPVRSQQILPLRDVSTCVSAALCQHWQGHIFKCVSSVSW